MSTTSGAQGSGEQPLAAASSSFPLPPLQYVNLYTDENVLKGRAPPPPPPITEGTYMSFGTQITINDAIITPLESQHWRRLYPRGDFDYKKELKKINVSILVNFLDLLDIIIRCPDTEKRVDKCHDISTLFINFHHLINELRPHQARETIRVAMSYQKKTREETAIALERHMLQVHKIVRNALATIPDLGDSKSGLESLLNSAITPPASVERPLISENNEDNPSNDISQHNHYQVDELDRLMCSVISSMNDSDS